MLNIWKSTLYLGNSFIEFTKIREILEQNKIKYNYKIHAHDEAMMSPGHGCGRTLSGINSTTADYKLYEISVNRKEFEKAKMLLS